jgi:hypothetical protein
MRGLGGYHTHTLLEHERLVLNQNLNKEMKETEISGLRDQYLNFINENVMEISDKSTEELLSEIKTQTIQTLVYSGIQVHKFSNEDITFLTTPQMHAFFKWWTFLSFIVIPILIG